MQELGEEEVSGLHEAVTRAIRDAWAEDALRPVDELAAAAAIRVVLAEAQRAVEALRTPTPAQYGIYAWSVRDTRLAEALAVLAALAEDDHL
jgi:hypothetical protein